MSAKGTKRSSRRPACLVNWTSAMHDTTTFRLRAVARMFSDGYPARARTARYPDAPPWPTDAYRTAINANANDSSTNMKRVAGSDVAGKVAHDVIR